MSDWVETLGILIASGTAVWGILKWRLQMISQRKMELAEEVLSAFYEAEDVIRAARSPGSFGGEGRSWRTTDDADNTQHELARVDAYFAPAERLFKERKFFARLKALQYRFRAVFGEQAQKHFDSVWDARHRVIISSTMLARISRERLEGAEGLDSETSKEWEAHIWAINETDEISQRVKQAVEAIESICQPVLTKWLKP